MKANQVIVLQVSLLGRTISKDFFDRHGVVENKDYLFFRFCGDDLLSQIEAGTPQLVFTSHTVDNSSFDIARKIKLINPQAFVVALTTSMVGNVANTELDGRISKYSSNSEKPSHFVKAFISGASREKLLQTLKSWNSEDE
ncbi:MAG: hypothetical protein RLY66_416 [Candidatus Parcubacteria bacterium]|jgi:DNA-binding NarL/FixJ family response regulator